MEDCAKCAPPTYAATGISLWSKLKTQICYSDRPSAVRRNFVPPKVRELVSELRRAGFVDRGGNGGHRNFVHPQVAKPITISGAAGDDAKRYQIQAVKLAVEESKS